VHTSEDFSVRLRGPSWKNDDLIASLVSQGVPLVVVSVEDII